MKGVFVVGAGPAGMFAARQIALAGYETFIFNRDVRPGGLAQYGIYPLKSKMKNGLRRQFAQVLEMDRVHYLGHVEIGAESDLTLAGLEAMRPAAIVFACGAQGAKRLGLPGEDARGIYAAKDFVYHYNQLAPYAGMDFSTGARVAIVGVGNVAIDIARWLLLDDPDRRAEQVTIIARRGPLEVKFDRKEIEYIASHLDPAELEAELDRVGERCRRAGQDVSKERVFAAHFPFLSSPGPGPVPPRLSIRFLSSPRAFLADDQGRVTQMVIAENELVRNADGTTSARAGGETATVAVDTVLFAIGDRHDPGLGLPMGPEGYATAPDPVRPGEPTYEVWDPAAGRRLAGRFVVGWARRASTGLAGIARHDGEAGAARVLEYLRDAPDPDTLSAAQIRASLERRGIRVAGSQELALLARAEEREGVVLPPNSFHFSKNGAIFQAIDTEFERARSEAERVQGAPAD